MSLFITIFDWSNLVFNDLWSNKYFHALGLLVGFFIISKLFVYISEKYILKLTAKTETKVDDLIVERTRRPISLLLVLIGIKLAMYPLGLPESILSIIKMIDNSFIVIVISYIVIIVIDILIEEWANKFAEKTRSAVDQNILSLFHRFSRIVFGILGLLFILQVWGIQVGPLLASLGIAGVAIAFALQSSLGNVFGGMSLILDKTIKKGDIIRLDSGEDGTVFDIGIRSTKIKTFDNELITVPNGKLSDSKIVNISQPDPSIRVKIEFGVEYGTDVEKVKTLVIDLVKNTKNVTLNPAPIVWLMDMGDFALKFRVLFWVDDIQKKMDVHQEVIIKIYKALNDAKIIIPFPTSTVYMKNV